MNIQAVFAFIFISLMLLFLILKRKKIDIQKIFLFPLLYFAMYRTKVGLRFMDRFSKKFSRILKHVGYFAVFIGFFGMIVITYALIKNAYKLLTVPEAVPGAALVLPFDVKGAFYVPFFYWIVSLFIIALVHEFSHGIIARKYKMRIKSSGFAFLGILVPVIPAAFVEPDEDELRKRPKREQLSVFAAGPFANILLAFIIVGISALLIMPVSSRMMEPKGVLVTGFMEEGMYPAEQAGISPNELITGIDGKEVTELAGFSEMLKDKKPGDIIVLETDRSRYNITLAANPDNESKAYLGIYVQQKTELKESFTERYGNFVPAAMLWIIGLLYWLYVLNLGIGLFNLAPMGPLDGGRMLLVALQHFFKEEKAVRYWKSIGVFFLSLVLLNVLFAFIR
ncbi:site-2 protease family protein [Candidatus Woesearchaeota archaeon]|nr:site-2 protease family protein [Candidatus Woesearchaeota archaeon]